MLLELAGLQVRPEVVDRQRAPDSKLVADDALRRWVRELLVEERVVMEGACAASLAAMDGMREELAGETVVFPISGRNVDPGTLRTIVDGE